MSVASASRTIKFISKAGTYTAVISSPSGDLYQMWEGSTAEVTNIFPDFTSVKPILYFVCMSSRTAEGVTTPDSIDFYVGSTKLTWSGDTSTNVFGGETGHFKKISPSGSQLYYGIQIVKNLVVPFGFAPVNIRMVAAVSYGTQSDSIEASYSIPISQSTGSAYKVTIAAGDTKNFIITEKGGSCKLKAMTYLSGNLVTNALSYVWEKLTSTGWVALAATTQEITVADTDIDTFGQFRVTVSQSGAELGKDIQGVMDASDPYDIDPCPSPEDETITEDTTGNGSITYTPKVVKRGTTTQAIQSLFTFVVKDVNGVYLNPSSERTTPAASCTVTRAQCIAGGGDISIDIFAVGV